MAFEQHRDSASTGQGVSLPQAPETEVCGRRREEENHRKFRIITHSPQETPRRSAQLPGVGAADPCLALGT